MPIDITRNIERYEAEDTFQFTLAASASRPNTVAFTVFNTNGNTLALEAVQSGATVAESGTNTGVYHFERVLPSSVGLYTYEWRAWDVTSRTYVNRGEFEIIRTEAHSFYSYGDPVETVRTARQIFGRGDITMRDLRPYHEEADAWIDTKLSPIVTVPVTPTPNFLRYGSKLGALYFYYSFRYAVEKDAAPPGIVDMWEKFNEQLDAIVAGSASIAGVISVEDAISVMPGDFKPVFDLRDPISQRVDPDLIDDEEDRDDE